MIKFADILNFFCRNIVWPFNFVFIKWFNYFINVTCACVWQIKLIFRGHIHFSNARWLRYTEIISLTVISSWDASDEFPCDKVFCQRTFLLYLYNVHWIVPQVPVRCILGCHRFLYLWNHWKYSHYWLKKVKILIRQNFCLP